MTIHLVLISHEDVFKSYSNKYNIFRDLYERDLLGLEIRNLPKNLEDFVKKIVLKKKEICYSVANDDTETVDFLALGSFGIFKEIAKAIVAAGNEDLGYKISNVLYNYTDYETKSFTLTNKIFSLDQTYIMGILNVTPDSFSDGGKYFDQKSAIEHAIKMIEDGADFIDVGGESTRPGAESLSEDEELNRVIPVIVEILNKKPEISVSIDTYKSKVAEEALSKGARIVNDISALTFDKNMVLVVKKFNASLVIMHMKGTPKSMQHNPFYEDVITEVYDFLNEKVLSAKKAGIKNIFIDPGIGFGKRVFDNYEIIKRLKEFTGIGCPILIGLSRKSFLGKALEVNMDEREIPTLIAETMAIQNGARIIRTHNVKNAVLAKKLTNFVENPDLLSHV
ncbi:MAG: dihydropteroate synthase [Ignavibacteria bacterium RBG_13_36_8]|nr:MAG: dihydropteroate synthase [Ignavibacteria bacterium RBG_13_36_8]